MEELIDKLAKRKNELMSRRLQDAQPRLYRKEMTDWLKAFLFLDSGDCRIGNSRVPVNFERIQIPISQALK